MSRARRELNVIINELMLSEDEANLDLAIESLIDVAYFCQQEGIFSHDVLSECIGSINDLICTKSSSISTAWLRCVAKSIPISSRTLFNLARDQGISNDMVELFTKNIVHQGRFSEVRSSLTPYEVMAALGRQGRYSSSQMLFEGAVQAGEKTSTLIEYALSALRCVKEGSSESKPSYLCEYEDSFVKNTSLLKSAGVNTSDLFLMKETGLHNLVYALVPYMSSSLSGTELAMLHFSYGVNIIEHLIAEGISLNGGVAANEYVSYLSIGLDLPSNFDEAGVRFSERNFDAYIEMCAHNESAPKTFILDYLLDNASGSPASWLNIQEHNNPDLFGEAGFSGRLLKSIHQCCSDLHSLNRILAMDACGVIGREAMRDLVASSFRACFKGSDPAEVVCSIGDERIVSIIGEREIAGYLDDYLVDQNARMRAILADAALPSVFAHSVILRRMRMENDFSV